MGWRTVKGHIEGKDRNVRSLAWGITYALSLMLLFPVLFMFMDYMVPALAWLPDWIGSGFETVPPDVNYESKRAHQDPPPEHWAEGALAGFFIFLLLLGYRLFEGKWPHER